VDFKSFMIFHFRFVILLFYSTTVLEFSIKYSAHRVAACTPILRTDSGMDSSGTNMHIDLANVIIRTKQQHRLEGQHGLYLPITKILTAIHTSQFEMLFLPVTPHTHTNTRVHHNPIFSTVPLT